MVHIISRNAWGARAWRGTPYSVSPSARTHFLVHYHGGEPRHSSGDANAKEIESIHLNNGWSGVGYNFIVGQDGAVREGRGWNLVGAHCPGHNTNGIGVYVAVGGNQRPSDAALRTVRALYDEACKRSGRTLVKSWHGANYPTACPGPHLIAWVKQGMIPPGGTTASSETASVDDARPRGGWDKSDVRRFQRAINSDNHPVDDDGVWGEVTEKQAQGVRKYFLIGDPEPSKWDRKRGWHLVQEHPTKDPERACARIQWSLAVVADGEWGEDTDAAWLSLRRWAYPGAQGYEGKR